MTEQELLEQQLNTLSTKIQELKSENEIFKNENAQIEQSLRDTKETLDNLAKRKIDAIEEDAVLQKNLQDKKESFDKLFLELNSTRDEYQRLTNETESLKAKKINLEQSIEAFNKSMRDKENDLNEREKIIKMNEVSLANYREELEIKESLLEVRERRVSEMLKQL